MYTYSFKALTTTVQYNKIYTELLKNSSMSTIRLEKSTPLINLECKNKRADKVFFHFLPSFGCQFWSYQSLPVSAFAIVYTVHKKKKHKKHDGKTCKQYLFHQVEARNRLKWRQLNKKTTTVYQD